MPRQRQHRNPGTGRIGATVLATALLAGGCGTGPDLPSGPIDLSAQWVTAPPEALGIDPDALERAVDAAAALPSLLSLVVVRHGRLAREAYFNGNRADRRNDVRSVTKSLVSTLVGVAIERGLLESVDLPIGPVLEDAYPGALDATEGAITVRDLLTMASGYAWDESTVAGYNDWVTADDPVRYLLDRPLAHPPGTRFTYNSAAVHLLSVVLERIAGRTVQQLAAESLFPALGIAGADWEILAGGRANGGSGIDLRPRDLAKLGQLWLQDGHAGAARLLPEGWVGTATTSRYPLWQASPPLTAQGYGYLWWIDHAGSRTHFFAWGHGGQFVWVAPELDLVVVVTTEWRSAPVSAGQLATNGLTLIVERVLPAVR
ncbi:MAG: serine hydrolase [Gemmatimonadales bacterium]